MSQGFFPLKVSKTVHETVDATTFYFEIPENLASEFVYTAGQYLTFEAEIEGEKVRRSYSLCTYSGVDTQPAVTVKKVDGGKMSNYMNTQVKAGDIMQAMSPMGKFTVIPNSNESKNYVLFAGGSGITPVLGIAKAVLNDEPQSKVTLIYANRDPESVIFKALLP
jgi:ring-1,2-phenylacetyl-CoA epoxidase subunit PaaE